MKNPSTSARFSSYMQYLQQAPHLIEVYEHFLREETSESRILREFSSNKFFGIFSLFVNFLRPQISEDTLQLAGLAEFTLNLDPKILEESARSLGINAFPSSEPDVISLTWEHFLNSVQDPKDSGTYFTPPRVGKLMAGLLSLGRGKKIVDPACGSGTLLLSYLRRYNSDQHIEVLKNIFGWDINPLNVAITRLNLLLTVMPTLNREDQTKASKILRQNIIVQDSLNIEALPQGFDAVILNPPYLRIELLKERKDTLSNFQFSHRRLDSYLLFLELCLKLINDQGEVSCIVPDKVLTESNGKILRQKILDTNYLRKVIDTRKIEIFRGAATVHPVILHLSPPDKAPEIEMYSTYAEDGESIKINLQSAIKSSIFRDLPSARIDPDLTSEYMSVLKKIFAVSFPLKEIAYVSYGAQPGIKKKFVFQSNIIPAGDDSLKWLLRGRDVKKYVVAHPNHVIKYNPEKLHRPAFPQLFQSPRVVVQKVTGSRGLIAGIVPEGEEYYTDDSIINIITLDRLAGVPSHYHKHRGFRYITDHHSTVPEGAHWWHEIGKDYARGADIRSNLQNYYSKYPPQLICAVINSQVVAFFYKLILAGGINVFPEHIRWLPITSSVLAFAPEIMARLGNLDNTDKEGVDAAIFQAYKLSGEEIHIIKKFLDNSN